MDDALPELGSNLARNLESLRRARGLSQAAVARLAGLPRSTLTHLEAGSGNPSLSTLARLAAGLQVSVEELLARPRASVQKLKRADLPRRKRGATDAWVLRVLPDPLPGLEIDRMELGPGARFGGIPHTRGTKEYLVCIEGRLRITVAGSAHEVEEGDVLAFPGDQPHAYANAGARRATALSVVALAPPGT